MDSVTIIPSDEIGEKFITDRYLKEGRDEYYHREKQTFWRADKWRNLRPDEVEELKRNNNTCRNWDKLLVSAEFDVSRIKNNEFFGLVRIGSVRDVFLEHHDLKVPVGITNSTIIDCDIGDCCACHNVGYLSHYIIGDRCIIFNINEMHTTNHAKFGNGIVKDGESEDVRVWLDVMNETGCRGILPFDSIITADAYLWAKYRDDSKLQKKLREITQNAFDSSRGYYGTVGKQSVIKNSRILKDVKTGCHTYIKGANKLKNLTIKSSKKEQTQIGEGVELVNGIIGFGCHIFYGCKAVRFILGNNSNLKYGARLINSFLGDNSTISCCEVLNNLIFPAHEQHHNNSFLIASVVLGQSNMAAGATIGSNHNSRANDNEIQAGRGFWPGLCSSVKHSCRFASFILLSKGDYPAELDIPFPFSLLNNNTSRGRLEIRPAFWWLYNMYAVARNTRKFKSRDKREEKVQNLEFDFLAPDTVEEILNALRLLELFTGKAFNCREKTENEAADDEYFVSLGKDLLFNNREAVDSLEVLGENMEKSKRKTLILNVFSSYHAYRDMVCYYSVKNLAGYMKSDPDINLISMTKKLESGAEAAWVNLGGQLVSKKEVKRLRSDIGSGILDTWDKIHKRYDELWETYPEDKQKHAYKTLCGLNGTDILTKGIWSASLDKYVEIQDCINNRVYESRKKDFENSFRKATYRNDAEMKATIGTIEDNSFVKEMRKETEEIKETVCEIRNRN